MTDSHCNIALFWTLVGCAVVGTFVFLLVVLSPARAHDWYTGYQNAKKESCCGGSDCAQLPDDAVRIVKGGYEVTYLPEDFPNAIEIQQFPIVVLNAEAQPGEDPVHFHMCIWGSAMKCFFVPAPGF